MPQQKNICKNFLFNMLNYLGQYVKFCLYS